MKIYDNVVIIPHEENKFGKTGDIYSNCCIGCPIEIGEQVHVSFGCNFVGQGKLILEDRVTISPGVVIYTSSPDFKQIKDEKVGTFAGNKYIEGFKINALYVRIMEGTFVGAGAIIGQGVTIGRYCIIGAGAFIKNSMPSYHVAIGNPSVYHKRRSIEKEEWCGD